jgi:hypothetical protein
MSVQTRSEILFERFCEETGTAFSRIPAQPAANRRTPDYELHLHVPPILAEVKQIDPNREDKALTRQYEAGGSYEFQHIAGKRVREKISEAASQLKTQAGADQPTLLVVYNNVDPLRGFTDRLAMMSAMYGQPEGVITTSRGLGAMVLSTSRQLGGSRRLTPKHNTTISAVAALFEGPEGLYLVVYHNRFAAHPIPPEVLRRPRIFQRSIRDSGPGEFPEWVEV